MLKIAVIGCGGIANNVHGHSHVLYSRNHTVDLCACCDIDYDKARVFAKDYGYKKAYTDYEHMLDVERPDVVCMYLPPVITCEHACRVLELGYPLFLEKPPGINAEQALRIKDTAIKHNSKYMIALNRRFVPIILKTVDHMKKHDIKPTTIEFSMVRNNRTDSDFSTTAIHGLDLVQFLSGGVYKSCDLRYQQVPVDGGVATNMFANAIMSNRVYTGLSFVNSSGGTLERVVIHAPNSTIEVKLPMWHGYDAPGEMVHIMDGKEIVHIKEKPTDMYISNGFYDEARVFFESIENDIPLTTDIDACISSMYIAGAMSRLEDSVLI